MKERTIQLGDWVEYTGNYITSENRVGRVLQVDKIYCLVSLNGVVLQLPKATLIVKVPIENHLKQIREDMTENEEDCV